METPYSHKVPHAIRAGMEQFTGQDCFLIKRRKTGLTGQGVQGNCHFNVKRWVDKVGGKRISGWLLYRNRTLLSKGLWVWSFHSVWQTPEGAVVDVTQDATYSGSDFTTVWLDNSRDIDLDEGTSYNNIVLIENSTSANEFGKSIGHELMPGVPYWTIASMKTVIPIAEHSGKYRWLDESYAANINRLKEEYNCSVVGGKLVPNEGAGARVSTKILFDYSIGG
jgi:hypothetical protein